jgi:hypothetical protein
LQFYNDEKFDTISVYFQFFIQISILLCHFRAGPIGFLELSKVHCLIGPKNAAKMIAEMPVKMPSKMSAKMLRKCLS